MTSSPSYTVNQTPPLSARIFLRLMGSSSLLGETITPTVTRVLSSFSSVFVLSVGQGKYALVDTGVDRNAVAILEYLESQHAKPNDVVAVFLTHSHTDHISGLNMFPSAAVYIGANDRSVIEATAKNDGFLPSLGGKLKKPALADLSLLNTIVPGQVCVVGDIHIRAYATPGHTGGSMTYLADEYLFIGDAVTFGSKGQARLPKSLLSLNISLAKESLRQLVIQLAAEGTAVKQVLPSHSGAGTVQSIRKCVLNK